MLHTRCVRGRVSDNQCLSGGERKLFSSSERATVTLQVRGYINFWSCTWLEPNGPHSYPIALLYCWLSRFVINPSENKFSWRRLSDFLLKSCCWLWIMIIWRKFMFLGFSFRASSIRATLRITNRCDFLYYVFISFFSSFPYMFGAFISSSSGVFQAVIFMLPFGSCSALLIVCLRQRTGLWWWLRCTRKKEIKT